MVYKVKTLRMTLSISLVCLVVRNICFVCLVVRNINRVFLITIKAISIPTNCSVMVITLDIVLRALNTLADTSDSEIV